MLSSSFLLPHAYFYGNWRAKVPNILQDEKSTGSREAIPLVSLNAVAPRPSSGTGDEVPIKLPQKMRTLWHEGYFRGAHVALPAEASRPLVDFKEERLETLGSGAFIFGQRDLEQTQNAQPVVRT